MTSLPQKFISALQHLYCKEVSPIIKPKYFATAAHVHYFISDLPKEKSVLLLYYSLPVSATLSGEQGDPSHCCLHRVGCASSSNISLPTTQAAHQVTYSCSTAQRFSSTNAFETPKRCQDASFIMAPRNAELKLP